MPRLTAFILSTVLVACGSSASSSGEAEIEEESLDWDTAGGEEMVPSSERGPRSAIALLGIHPPDKPWAEMTHEEREWDMVGRFLPIMQELFADLDEERWGHIECESCHGEDAEAREYEMPAPTMIPIPAEGTPSYEAAKNAQPRVTQYMEQTIVPTMRTLLGFGDEGSCSTCHPTVGAQAAREARF
ncbi:MAG: hypothetical protein ACFCGT_18660 [Sandaracinaceae bacterium]